MAADFDAPYSPAPRSLEREQAGGAKPSLAASGHGRRGLGRATTSLIRARSGDGAPLKVMNADGSGRKILIGSRDSALFTTPPWSPDGTQIAYSRGVRDSEQGIFMVRSNGRGAKEITKPLGGLDQYPGRVAGRVRRTVEGLGLGSSGHKMGGFGQTSHRRTLRRAGGWGSVRARFHEPGERGPRQPRGPLTSSLESRVSR
jgi:hypothetical protein